ncbi:MAG: ABC transporter ATP-binding protein [Rhodospirillaceae bacterium]|nr:ABC transporter ATP-binding protein [Rhodospirillaceae bacterium]MBT4590181.1 ABC transporter ATP-binding protein [Rhodospirillaceae bacterium]MBT4939015.1 ABC transporter ATP-binding protein [Rhodospirillaceae bacterium]MBT7265350.1 ABC transporter ATP-binding protein [Rhodospirillaceae bacterium]
MLNPPLLSVNNLEIAFKLDEGLFRAVSKVSFELEAGKTLGLVGESGSGKSLTALSLLRLIPEPGSITQGEIKFNGEDILKFADKNMRALRGNNISMIFQEPMTALNPVLTIGEQIAEALTIHDKATKRDAQQKAIAMLDRVGIPDAALRALDHPHNLSGGMRQRAMIAMALICKPDILIADEATTALDTTVQAQILDLLIDLQHEFNMAILFISHNLGVVSEIADDVMVMYGGRIMEASPAPLLFDAPQHPYTQVLLSTLPNPALRGQPLTVIEGSVPTRYDLLAGCRFAPRCNRAIEQCMAADISLVDIAPNQRSACINMAGQ